MGGEKRGGKNMGEERKVELNYCAFCSSEQDSPLEGNCKTLQSVFH